MIEKIDNRELEEVAQLDDIQRADQGFGCSNTTMDHQVKSHNTKPGMEINKISATAGGQIYRRGETTGILRVDEVDNVIMLEAINIPTGLVMKNNKKKEVSVVRYRVTQEYQDLLDVFEKGEKSECTTQSDQVSIWELS